MTKGGTSGSSGATSGPAASRKIPITGSDSQTPDQLSSLTNLKTTQSDVLPELQSLAANKVDQLTPTLPVAPTSGPATATTESSTDNQGSDPAAVQTSESGAGLSSYNNNTEKNDLTPTQTQPSPLIGPSLTPSGENKWLFIPELLSFT